MAPAPVLLLNPSADWYGADRQVLTLATGLDPERYRPLVVLPERGGLGAALNDAGIEVLVAPLAVLRREMLRGGGIAATARQLRRSVRALLPVMRDRRIRLVHTNTSILLGGQRIARAAGARHLLHVREIYGGAGPDWLWPLMRRRLLRADGVVCVSDATAAPLGRRAHVKVVRDGVARAIERGSRAAARETLGVPPDSFVVAVVGRISDWKGQHVLVRALAHPELARRGAVAVLAGEAAPGQERFQQRLTELQDSLHLNGRVRQLGFQQDLTTLFSAADVVAVPSVYADPLPNVALEAALAGLPVVGTRTGGLEEILSDGETGRLVPPGDDAALAQALVELAADPEGGARLGKAAARDVAERFGRDRMLHAIQESYDRLLS